MGNSIYIKLADGTRVQVATLLDSILIRRDGEKLIEEIPANEAGVQGICEGGVWDLEMLYDLLAVRYVEADADTTPLAPNGAILDRTFVIGKASVGE